MPTSQCFYRSKGRGKSVGWQPLNKTNQPTRKHGSGGLCSDLPPCSTSPWTGTAQQRQLWQAPRFWGQMRSVKWHMGSAASSSLLAFSGLAMGKAASSPHALFYLGSGLSFAKLLSFSAGSDFPEDKLLFTCQDHPQGKR